MSITGARDELLLRKKWGTRMPSAQHDHRHDDLREELVRLRRIADLLSEAQILTLTGGGQELFFLRMQLQQQHAMLNAMIVHGLERMDVTAEEDTDKGLSA